MAKGKETGIPKPVTQVESEMAQPPSCSLEGSSPPSPYLHNLPSWVLEDFCQKMDCLNEYDWMRFASHVITDQTELRKIKCMEKAGISITRELMWWWGVRLATVQQLLELLQELEFYRAAQVISDWKSQNHDSARTLLKSPEQEKDLAHENGKENKEKIGNGMEVSSSLPYLTQMHKRQNDPLLKVDSDVPPLSLPPTSMDLPHSLHSNFSDFSNGKEKASPNRDTASLLWMPREVEIVTSGFNEKNRISEGLFATTYRGQRDNAHYVVKKLKENEAQVFFRTEVQICFRCCHPNILQLLGFCVESGLHSLIYPYMENGSLLDRLQCQDSSEALSWEKRTSISLGLIKAIQHLHQFGIIHGNIKSSNVLLDANFVPQLGHSGLRLHPVEKKSEYTVIKTKVLKASLAYFPEDFVRHGQLTEKVDIFACGIVLAEILTGMKAVDERRNPIFLKDALLEELRMAKELSCIKEKNFENLAAIQICYKYQDKQTVCLPETVSLCLATSVCICLRKKNANTKEVNEMIEIADHQTRSQDMSESRNLGLLTNIPEETNDEPASPFNVDFYGHNHQASANSGSLNCVTTLPPCIKVLPPETYSEQILREPCESDESCNFSWDTGEHASCCAPPEHNLEPENLSFTKPVMFTAKNTDSDRKTNQQQRKNDGAACSSQALMKEIKINDKKKQLMEKITLYDENKINSYDLFESSI
ncbi:interleukin-1 receptor-associated kinase-like 2 isoform X1 [Thamnophis elegans]|uniref:interleukin-1 receptor-associated kinase-like 2 isoform X1 n=1 Tax=Thamnophis elegans TaxID=35005 RepID=UPI00137882EC|nr:interleukin-1 receptor-associated kinase-like 2 isoform X1 [Thamnophis elegans]XP_032067140.1 interleukin-1 receptor-associated kinase-like 2 isoform X1 [Thamnophis elegans]XP_032067141.1 interleukin-1 receptor-associated kinase-like 2 isoform X1 [Thamnophis elegans]